MDMIPTSTVYLYLVIQIHTTYPLIWLFADKRTHKRELLNTHMVLSYLIFDSLNIDNFQ